MNFNQCIAFMEKTGKKLFHSGFRIHASDHHLIYKLLVYTLQDTEEAKNLGISLHKGILLTGPVGCGKTSLMTLLRQFQPPEKKLVVLPCRNISFEFIQNGYSVIQKYSTRAFYRDQPVAHCFDDLGTENSLKYFGNECNVMAEILLSRYDLFLSLNMLTHITTNLNSSEIENIYGVRVRSRLREQFNLIAFDAQSRDKRC